MTGCDMITVEYLGTFKKLCKFHIAVTVDAGVRGSAVRIAVYEFINYLIFKII